LIKCHRNESTEIVYVSVAALLMPSLLQAQPSARVININSSTHSVGCIELDDMEMKRNYLSFNAYSRSKLTSLMCTFELAKRLPEDSKVHIISVDPGVAVTGITRDIPRSLSTLFSKLSGTCLLSSSEAADPIVYAAVTPLEKRSVRTYLAFCRPAVFSLDTTDEKVVEAVWNYSCDQLRLHRDWPNRLASEEVSKS
jgi:NAD(P)-dependent dehydrogenase (short-subunit alcohol dehydrogenase family)